MSDGHRLPKEHENIGVCYEEVNGNNYVRPPSILSTGSKTFKKSVSFSEWDSVYLLSEGTSSPDGREHRCGYLLDVKQTFTNLLDDNCLADVDEDAEVELMNVVHDQEINNVKPNECSFTSATNGVVVCSSTAKVTDFYEQEKQRTGKKNISVDLASKSNLSSDDRVDREFSFWSTGDPYSCSIEESRGKSFNKRPAEETSKERRFWRVRRQLQNTIAKADPYKVKQKELKDWSSDIGSQTCEAIKDYIVGLSGTKDPNRFSRSDLDPMFVAVKGTLSKKVIRKESTMKDKKGLDLVGTHYLRNHNINCAIRFYYDKDTKEFAENMFQQ